MTEGDDKAKGRSASEIASYDVIWDTIAARVIIRKEPEDYVPQYVLSVPRISGATEAYLDDVKTELLKKVSIGTRALQDEKALTEMKGEIIRSATGLLRTYLPGLDAEDYRFMAVRMVQDMLGMGDLEFLLADDNLEELCVNGHDAPIWVYHRKLGWLKTNIVIHEEAKIRNYASAIGRRIGRQITVQDPLLDAHLLSGDRLNATLAPISPFGNTITVRKFARKPWTITDMLDTKTLDIKTAAFLWLCLQYELNVLVSGGTGSGKTSFMNVLTAFLPPNQRVVSIEQTREIRLPVYLQWVPLVVREATSEGKGSISMLDLMINALRMRPDRIIVGEVRGSDEASVLFEAMHTGHSVYSTLHAETAKETIRRLSNPPIDIPPVVLGSLHLVATMYRDRRTGIRRIFEVVELLPSEKEIGVTTNTLFRWKPYKDEIVAENPSIRVIDTLKVFTRMDEAGIAASIAEKEEALLWMRAKGINTVDAVGKTVAEYYGDPKLFMARIREDGEKEAKKKK